jgi:hypothetical protein
MSTPYNEYTKEDLLLLNNMVDANRDNPNLRYPLITHTDEYGIERLFSNEDIEKNSYDHTLKAFIDFLTSGWGATMLPKVIYLFNNIHLDEMPLYIGNNDSRGLIARWRLQIGK